MGFPRDFMWGAASAAYQIEGAYNEDGKGPGIWDALSAGHVKHGENGNVACDHYHRYREDIALMKEIGLKSYRFSVSWPRVIPAPGQVNEAGLDFYRRLVDELVNAGIEPICTLFHWDLPLWVHEKGGWHTPELAEDFAFYTKTVVEALSHKVRYWITLNEPASFIGNGYITGLHAPFESALDRSVSEMAGLAAGLTKIVLLAHGRAVQVIRATAKKPPLIGMALNGGIITPASDDAKAIAEAKAASFPEQAFFSHVSWWADPTFLGKVPAAMQGVFSPEELELVHQKLDFFGYNCYCSANYDEYVGPNPAVTPGMPRTTMDWPITPDVLYWAAKFLTERYGLPLLITENGMANTDFVMSDGKVHDPQRIEFLKGYLSGLQKAAQEGVPLLGYCYWSVLDNFEWADGYDKRFGLIYVDYSTQKRTLKDSAGWYSKVIQDNAL
ncbi:MAG: family 1 glycosylhydrolase [Ruminococcus flavefaciens]|nr:family 1 glycosylhydrolase [Ruminococcus flavefaciens]